MADDIVTRLYCSYGTDDVPCEKCTFCAARAEIERLRAERDMLADAVTAQVSPDLSPETARLLLRNAIYELEARRG